MAVFLKAREGYLAGDMGWNKNKYRPIIVDMNDAGPAPGAWVITSVTSSGVAPNIIATVTTSAAHGLAAGQTVELFLIGGATQLNGVFVVNTVPTTTTFTISMASVAVSAYTSGGYIANLSLTFLSQFVPAVGRVSTAPALDITNANHTVLNGVADTHDVTFPTVPGPDPVEAILIVRAAALPADADLADTAQRLVWLNTPSTPGTTGLPVTPNGGDINVTWNAQGLFAI